MAPISEEFIFMMFVSILCVVGRINRFRNDSIVQMLPAGGSKVHV